MRNFRLLTADEIECRVQTATGKGVSLLLYKTARTDAKLLDETYGAGGWQNKYELINGNMYCGIGIKFGDEWIWKWNCGTESNTEAEKGQASDAFKRAGFTWGVGTELYKSPFIWIDAANCRIEQKNGKYVCRDRFTVQSIDYDDSGTITSLCIVNGKNAAVFTYGAKAGKQKPAEPEQPAADIPLPPPAADGYWYCADCGNLVAGAKNRDGTRTTPKELVIMTVKRYNKPLCADCFKKSVELSKKAKNADS